MTLAMEQKMMNLKVGDQIYVYSPSSYSSCMIPAQVERITASRRFFYIKMQGSVVAMKFNDRGVCEHGFIRYQIDTADLAVRCNLINKESRTKAAITAIQSIKTFMANESPCATWQKSSISQWLTEVAAMVETAKDLTEKI